MTKTISVIVPVYNAEPYLRECLDSVCGQTFQNLEMIPLAELPQNWDQTVIYNTPPQNL